MFDSDDSEFMEEMNKEANRFQRLLFFNDLERFPNGVIAIDVDEFIEIFGIPNDDEFKILTKCLFNDFRRYDINNPKFIRKIEDKWSLNWIEYILQWNANEEKYERCAKIRDFVNSFKEISVDDKKNVKNINVEII
jgi:hypothetical protein